MPENETLFLETGNASRWCPLKARVAAGEALNAILPTLADEIYLALRWAVRWWKRRGVLPEQLFAAAVNDPTTLRALVNRTGNEDCAQLLQDCTAGEVNPDRETVLRSFLDSFWEHVRGHLQLDCREGGVPPSFLDDVGQILDRIARGLLRNPSRIPPRPPRKGPPPDIDDFLGQSLPLA
jgi:hypothetical protein